MTPEQFKAARVKAGLSQVQLAAHRHLQITSRQIINYEMGNTPIPAPVAFVMENLAIPADGGLVARNV